MDFDAAIKTLASLDAMDNLDIVAPGHTTLSTLDDIKAYRMFLEGVKSEVQQAIAKGTSVEDMAKTIKLDAYSDWTSYNEWLPLTVESMHGYLSK